MKQVKILKAYTDCGTEAHRTPWEETIPPAEKEPSMGRESGTEGGTQGPGERVGRWPAAGRWISLTGLSTPREASVTRTCCHSDASVS